MTKTNAERLERINDLKKRLSEGKSRFEGGKTLVEVSLTDLNNLLSEAYQQAERANELEKEVNGLHWRNLSPEWIKSQEENKRLREALDFYADADNYSRGIFKQHVLFDGGRLAKKALEGVSDDRTNKT